MHTNSDLRLRQLQDPGACTPVFEFGLGNLEFPSYLYFTCTCIYHFEEFYDGNHF